MLDGFGRFVLDPPISKRADSPIVPTIMPACGKAARLCAARP